MILAVRFLYGLRTVLPFTIGMSAISALRFQVLNFAGAVLWSVLVAAAAISSATSSSACWRPAHYEELLFAAILVGGIGVLAVQPLPKEKEKGVRVDIQDDPIIGVTDS